MFGLDTIKVAIVGALAASVITVGALVYHGIQAAEAAKIELQQAKLVAAAQQAQAQRSIDALQTQAAQAAALAARNVQLVEALDAAPKSSSCLTSGAGRAFSRWLHDGGRIAGAPNQAPAQSVAVPAATGSSR